MREGTLEPEEDHTARDDYFQFEADSLEQLQKMLEELGLDASDLHWRHSPPEERFAGLDPGVPETVTGDILSDVAREVEEIAQNLPEAEEIPEPSWERVDQIRTGRSVPVGAALRRARLRQEKLIQSEGAYYYLHQAMIASRSEDRQIALQELEILGALDHLARVAEHSPHLITRKNAVDILYRLKAVPQLEAVALFSRPPLLNAVKGRPELSEEFKSQFGAESGTDPLYDEVQILAVDRLAQLADQEVEGALEALFRVARYDFTPNAHASFRALRRLGERIPLIERRRDFDGLVFLYHYCRSRRIQNLVVQTLGKYIEELAQRPHEDALLVLTEGPPELAEIAEELLDALERNREASPNSLGG